MVWAILCTVVSPSSLGEFIKTLSRISVLRPFWPFKCCNKVSVCVWFLFFPVQCCELLRVFLVQSPDPESEKNHHPGLFKSTSLSLRKSWLRPILGQASSLAMTGFPSANGARLQAVKCTHVGLTHLEKCWKYLHTRNTKATRTTERPHIFQFPALQKPDKERGAQKAAFPDRKNTGRCFVFDLDRSKWTWKTPFTEDSQLHPAGEPQSSFTSTSTSPRAAPRAMWVPLRHGVQRWTEERLSGDGVQREDDGGWVISLCPRSPKTIF